MDLKFPVTGYNFKVMINGSFISFSKVMNLESRVEFEQYQEGGTNDRMLLFRRPKSNADELKLERGVWSTDAGFKLEPGTKIEDITIMVMRGLIPLKIYTIEQGYVSSVTYSDLDAMSGDVIIESMTILHSGLTTTK